MCSVLTECALPHKSRGRPWSAWKSNRWEIARCIIDNSKTIRPWIDWNLTTTDEELSILQYQRSRSIRGTGLPTSPTECDNRGKAWCCNELFCDSVTAEASNRPEAMNVAAREGHLEAAKWLHKHREKGCTTSAMNEVAENGHLKAVKWLRAYRNESCTTSAMDTAACSGLFNVVMELLESQSEWCTRMP